MTFKTDAAAMAVFRKNVIPLRQGESVQLQVEIVDTYGKATDVTRSPNEIRSAIAVDDEGEPRRAGHNGARRTLSL